MINIIIPMGGRSEFFEGPEYIYPKALIELNGQTMIQRVIDNYSDIKEKRFIFIVNEADVMGFHIDAVLKLLTDDKCEVIKLRGNTRGATCSALMAIALINNDMPLIIANGDQVIDADIAEIQEQFEKTGVDAAVITFQSVHPKWSYIRLDETLQVIEAAEKKPLSKHAIAGFYYFKRGQDFVKSAMKIIEKDAHVNEIFYISPVLNEIILDGKKVSFKEIDTALYHSFYSPAKIAEYENISKKIESAK